ELGGLSYPLYNVALLFVSVVTGGLLAWSLGRTRRGKMLLAIIHDREMSAALGMNVRRVYLITFTLGGTSAASGGGPAPAAGGGGREWGGGRVGDGRGGARNRG